MKWRIILAAALVLATTAVCQALTICKGEFALCAASTCRPTGNVITTNSGVSWPEASCICPILVGPSFASPTSGGGNMKGVCTPPKSGVWSTFAPRNKYPQAVTGWKKSAVVPQVCAASLNLGAQTVNCFSFACTYAGRRNGRRVADCRCPIGQGPDGPMPEATEFGTMAGQGDPSYCAMNPVSAPLPSAAMTKK